MKNVFLLIIICALNTALFAQKVSIKWDGEIQTKSGQLGFSGEYSDGVYTYSVESYSAKSIVTVMDKNRKTTTQEISGNSNYGIKVVSLFASKKGTYLIIRGLTKKVDKAMIGYVKVTNGIADKEIKEILTYDYDGGNYGDNGIILQSPDASKLAIEYTPAKGEAFNYIILNDDMNIIQKINKASTYSNTKTVEYSLDNNGILSLWSQKNTYSQDEVPSIKLIRFTADNQSKDVSVKLPNALIEDFSINKLGNGKQLMVGTYYNKDNASRGGNYGYVMGARVGFIGGVNGVFVVLLDSNGISSPKLYPFPDKTIMEFDVQKKHIDKGIPLTEFAVLANKFDNSVTIFMEETNKSSTTSTYSPNSSYSHSSTSTTYYTNYILVTKINSAGGLQYSTLIEKKCKYGQMLDYGSYFPFFKEDNLYVLYNKSLVYEEKKRDIDQKGQVLSELVKINNSGDIVSSEILFGNKDVDVVLTPIDCSTIDDNKIKLVGMDKRKIKYGILEVK